MKASLKPLLILLTIIMLIACNEQKPKDPCTELDEVDLQMLNMLDSIKTKYKSEELFENRFKLAQVSWTQYRDRHLRALYPKDWDRVYRAENSRELFNSCICKEMSRLTQLRIDELNMYFQGGPGEQQECPSSWN